MEFALTFLNLSHICNHSFIFWVLKKAVSLRQIFLVCFFFFVFQRYKLYIVVSFIIMEEVCYTDFYFKSFTVLPFVMMKEVCCMAVTALQKCCVNACKGNHSDFLNSCEPLQNIVNVEALCNHGFICWVLKRTVSLRQYF